MNGLSRKNSGIFIVKKHKKSKKPRNKWEFHGERFSKINNSLAMNM